MEIFITKNYLAPLDLMECLLYYTIFKDRQWLSLLNQHTLLAPEIAVDKNLKAYLMKGFDVPSINDHLESRISLMLNNDLNILLSSPKNLEQDYFYKNTDGDEVIFVHKGTGVLRTYWEN